jgi:DinB superfamily
MKATLKSVLLAQLKTTNDEQNWFVPASKAVAGLTAVQAVWKDGKGNHSIAELVSHLIVWNDSNLAKFEKPPTFDTFVMTSDKASWDAAVRRLNDTLTGLEEVVEAADDEQIASWSSTIANISTHNAYHIGQIIYIRKLQGSWDPEKGVK